MKWLLYFNKLTDKSILREISISIKLHVYLFEKQNKMNSSVSLHNFNKLFNEYYERFIRFAMSYVKERQIAEDFVSEAFTAFWENREKLSQNTNPPAYILTIVRNKCINHLQHIQASQRIKKELGEHAEWRLSVSINSLQACDPDFLFSEEIQQIIDHTLRRLPQKTRRIFILSRYEGLSYPDIAAIMNLSPKTIEFHISKALSQFRLSLKDFIYLSPFLFYFC